MKEVKEAVRVNAFEVEGLSGLYKKVSKGVAMAYQKEAGENDPEAVQAISGSAISWFIPYKNGEE